MGQLQRRKTAVKERFWIGSGLEEDEGGQIIACTTEIFKPYMIVI